MNYYIISDTHLGHEAIVGYCNRPADHERKILSGLTLLPADGILIHLGDVCIGDDAQWHLQIDQRFSGQKILVLGNHDTKSASWYYEHGWDFVCDSFKFTYCSKKLCFSHKPQPWDGDWEINIHGHLHNLGHRDGEFKELKQWHRLYSPELMNYSPIELSKFIQTDPFQRTKT